MAYPKAVGIGRLVALGAEEVAFDVGRHVAVLGRRARAERKARLAGVERHLVLLVFARGGAHGNGPREELLVADAVDAGAAIAPDRIRLHVATQEERGIRGGRLISDVCVGRAANGEERRSGADAAQELLRSPNSLKLVHRLTPIWLFLQEAIPMD